MYQTIDSGCFADNGEELYTGLNRDDAIQAGIDHIMHYAEEGSVLKFHGNECEGGLVITCDDTMIEATIFFYEYC